MEASSLLRRKACDLCFTKKIKCDMLKPVCSNCVLYKAECRTTAVRRRAPPPKEKEKEKVPTQAADDPDRMSRMEARLERIESQLEQVLRLSKAPFPSGTSESLDDEAAEDASTIEDDALPEVMDYLETLDERGAGREGRPSSRFATASGSSSSNLWFSSIQDPSAMKLPPLDDILPLVTDYFVFFNTAIPLFHQPTFMRMLHEWYGSPASSSSSSSEATAAGKGRRDTAAWAAVNIVLALSHRCTLERRIGFGLEGEVVTACLRNAQSVVSDLVTRDGDLLGLQVLLGLVLLFQGTRDARPASVLIGTAVRLAHRMQLQARDVLGYFPVEVQVQRKRLFWLTYMLDKDISLRGKTPSFQLDADIDLDLPEASPPDGAGMLFNIDGSASINYFRLRVELGHIGGKVYDLLYSTRAQKVTADEKAARVRRLEGMLDQWRRKIPSPLQLEAVLSQSVSPIVTMHLAGLYHTYLMSLVMVHGIYSHDSDWVSRISAYSRVCLDDIGKEMERTAATVCMRSTERLPLPQAWAACVETSRACMRLFGMMPQTDFAIWASACAFFSGLIILLGNMLVFPDHAFLGGDRGLIDKGMQVFDVLLPLNNTPSFQRLHSHVVEMRRRAFTYVEATARERESGLAAEATLGCPNQCDDGFDFLENDEGPFGRRTGAGGETTYMHTM